MKNTSLQRIIFSLIVLTCFCMTATLLSCKHESNVPFVEVQSPENESDVRLIKALRAFIPHVVKDRGTPGLNIALSR